MPPTGKQPRRHHHASFPPQQYRDLRSSDIFLLTPLFGPTPSRTLPSYAAHETDIRKKISELPSHLRSKISILSSFCSVHKQLNPLPISSILSIIQDEVTPQALFHWAPVERSSWLDVKTLSLLEEMNTVWQNPDTFRSNFGRAPNPATRWKFIDHKCAACKLSEIANNVPGIVALGACVIARIDPENWKKSKRIQWFEKWIAVSVESGDLIEAMWECGVKLRNAMSASLEDTPFEKTPRKRAYIDDFVAQTKAPLRPARSDAQDGHVAFVFDTELHTTGGKVEDDDSDSQSIKTIRRPSPRPPPAAPSTETPPKLPTRYVHSLDFFARLQEGFLPNDSKTLLRPESKTPAAPHRPSSSEYSPPRPNTPFALPRPASSIDSQSAYSTPASPRRPTTSIYSQPALKTPAAPARPASSVYSQPSPKTPTAPPRPGSSVYSQLAGFRVASSIYSRATDEDDVSWDNQPDWFPESVLDEGEFIDSYKRSTGGTHNGYKPDERGFF